MFIALSICIFSYTAVALNKNQFADSYNQKVILADINAYRHAHGLDQLKLNRFLSEQAKNHSLEMAENKTPFGHAGFNQRVRNIFNRFQSQAIAENVAFTNEEAKTVVKLWLNSRGHRKNIEGNYNMTGIGLAYDKYGRVYVTQIFLKM